MVQKDSRGVKGCGNIPEFFCMSEIFDPLVFLPRTVFACMTFNHFNVTLCALALKEVSELWFGWSGKS